MEPRHLQLRQQLFSRWKSLGLSINDPIESQNTIVNTCDFSLSTVVKTLQALESDGIIERKVGVGSYLKSLPWQAGHMRIGFFYNREAVGRGVLTSTFYAPMIREMESQILQAGDEFTFGSFTRDNLPIDLWNQLDVVILTGIVKNIPLAGYPISSALVLMDSEGEDDIGDSFTLNLQPAYIQLAHYVLEEKINKILYIDSVHTTKQQGIRKSQFFKTISSINPHIKIASCLADVEFGGDKTEALFKEITSFKPEMICGYIHQNWRLKIHKEISPAITILPIITEPNQAPGFYANMSAWVSEVVTHIDLRMHDRRAPKKNISHTVQLTIE